MKKTGKKQVFNLKKVEPTKLKAGITRHKELTDGFIERVINYKKKLSEVDKTSLESTLLNFRRDINPEQELKIWEWIATNYECATQNNPKLSIKMKKEHYMLLLNSTLEVNSLDVKNSKV